jgi:hypothetical protein
VSVILKIGLPHFALIAFSKTDRGPTEDEGGARVRGSCSVTQNGHTTDTVRWTQ